MKRTKTTVENMHWLADTIEQNPQFYDQSTAGDGKSLSKSCGCILHYADWLFGERPREDSLVYDRSIQRALGMDDVELACVLIWSAKGKNLKSTTADEAASYLRSIANGEREP